MPRLDPATLGLFLTASLALLVSPGPAVLYIVARSLDQGRIAGLVAAAGMNAGGLVHVGLAAGGLAAMAATSPAILSAVQLAGGVYLVWLGVRTVRAGRETGTAGVGVGAEGLQAAAGLPRIFRESVVVSLLNPKALTFFFAYLPQFADPRWGSLPVQLLWLGLAFIALAVVTDTAWALVAGAAGGWLRARPGFSRGLRVASGVIYLGLGAAAGAGAVRGLA